MDGIGEEFLLSKRRMDRLIVKQILKEMNLDFRETGKNLNGRCVLCGDSKKSKIKKRGWILFKGNIITYYCFNCTASLSFSRFVKELAPSIWSKYFRNKDINKAITNLDIKAKLVEEEKEVKQSDLVDVSSDILPVSFHLFDKDIKSIALKQLQYRALKEVLRRKIPKEYYVDFLVCYEQINHDSNKNFEKRLIIPFYDTTGLMYAFQGRSLFDGQTPKYKTWNRTNPKIYNYYDVNPEEIVLVTEGPIDSMFLYNGISTSGTISYGGDKFHEIYDKFPKRGWVFDYDKTGILKAIEWAENGELVFCWPKEWKNKEEKVDINEVFLRKNLTLEMIAQKVKENLYTSLSALTRLKIM